MHAYIRNFYLSLGTETLKSSDEPVIRGTSVVNWGNMGIFSWNYLSLIIQELLKERVADENKSGKSIEW